MKFDLDELIEKLADRIVAKLSTGSPADMVDQASSPLGKRRHCAAVRERVTRGAPGAAIVGRKHLLSREELQKELAVVSKTRAPRRVAPIDPVAELRKELGIFVPDDDPRAIAARAIDRARRNGALRKIPRQGSTQPNPNEKDT